METVRPAQNDEPMSRVTLGARGRGRRTARVVAWVVGIGALLSGCAEYPLEPVRVQAWSPSYQSWGGLRTGFVQLIEDLRAHNTRLRRFGDAAGEWLERGARVKKHAKYADVDRQVEATSSAILLDPSRSEALVALMLLGMTEEERKLLWKRRELGEEQKALVKEEQDLEEEAVRLRARYDTLGAQVQLAVGEGLSQAEVVAYLGLIHEAKAEFKLSALLRSGFADRFDPKELQRHLGEKK